MREAYLRTGSVHRAALEFGMCGETFRKKLLETGFKLNRPKWSTLEIDTLKRAYGMDGGFDIPVIATALNRTYAAVACKADELGLCSERGKQIRTPTAIAHYSAAQKEVSARPGVIEQRVAHVKAYHKEHGHPRGFFGHKRKPEELAKMVEGTRRALANPNHRIHSKEFKQNKSDKISKAIALRPKGNAYSYAKGGWREIGGVRIYARSKWEANYARFLEWLKSNGWILQWEHEPETFWFEKIKRGVRSYLPDFRVTSKDGSVSYHEVKGWMDNKSKTKMRRMKKYHPKIDLKIFGADWFKANNKTMAAMIQDWEL